MAVLFAKLGSLMNGSLHLPERLGEFESKFMAFAPPGGLVLSAVGKGVLLGGMGGWTA